MVLYLDHDKQFKRHLQLKSKMRLIT